MNSKSRALMVLALGFGAAACSAYDPNAAETETETAGTTEAALRKKGHSCGGFELSSCSFEDGDPLPYASTCEGQAFSAGQSPSLSWTKPPKGTKSLAIVLKDLTLVDGPFPNRAYHWALFDIHHSIRRLPEGIENVQFPSGLKGAQQISAFGPFPNQYFGPCPSWENLCSGGTVPRVTDTYTFTLYAFDTKTLELPPPDPAITNRVRQLDAFFASIAIGQAELGFTSDARPSSFPQACPDAG